MGKFITPYGDRKFFKGKGRKKDIDLNERQDNYQDKVLKNIEKSLGIKPKKEAKEEWELELEKKPAPESILTCEPLKPKPFTGKIRVVKKDGTIIEKGVKE